VQIVIVHTNGVLQVRLHRFWNE